jgi:hypothetical protein
MSGAPIFRRITLRSSLPPRPEYFGREVELNRQGASRLDELPPLAANLTGGFDAWKSAGLPCAASAGQ